MGHIGSLSTREEITWLCAQRWLGSDSPFSLELRGRSGQVRAWPGSLSAVQVRVPGSLQRGGQGSSQELVTVGCEVGPKSSERALCFSPCLPWVLSRDGAVKSVLLSLIRSGTAWTNKNVGHRAELSNVIYTYLKFFLSEMKS